MWTSLQHLWGEAPEADCASATTGTHKSANLLHPIKTRVPMRPLAPGYGGNNVPGSGVLDRKFAAADADGDSYINYGEAFDFVRYHEKADVDGDGTISMEEMVAWLKPLEAKLYSERQKHEQGLSAMDAERRKLLEQIEATRAELVEMGVEPEAAVRGKSRSSFCTVM